MDGHYSPTANHGGYIGDEGGSEPADHTGKQKPVGLLQKNEISFQSDDGKKISVSAVSRGITDGDRGRRRRNGDGDGEIAVEGEVNCHVIFRQSTVKGGPGYLELKIFFVLIF